ncbi:SGNH/GDSL hydrolase family protein [Paenibacillus tianmuensis]|uniref:SGNH/GDSL hydrolase family protein n=1 Tax=Paenibacillus tianmuensis TaxID=624147 RepID=UPI0014308CFA|nr:SGNH/GDSL hydrolase family protein [Paenibacillus tianmuensis]
MSSIIEYGTHYSLREGIGRTVRKLKSGGSVTIAFMGGSVTAGHGASDPEQTSYRARLIQYLTDSFKQTAFRFIHAAVGGTDSVYGAYRLQGHVFRTCVPDLLFVEFAASDNGRRQPSLRAMEGIVRHARTLNPHMDICFIYTAKQSGYPYFLKMGRPHVNVCNHEEVAEHYRLPSVDMATEIYRRMASGSLTWDMISGDGVHPNNAGHLLYAQLLKAFMSAALEAVPGPENAAAVLPSRIDSFCYDQGMLVSSLAAEKVKGFRYVTGWSPEKICDWKPPVDILQANAPGAVLRIHFTGTAVGMALMAGMDTGEIVVRIDGKLSKAVPLFDAQCRKCYRPKTVLFADDLPPGDHVAEVELSVLKREDSIGRALHILYFLINGQLRA